MIESKPRLALSTLREHDARDAVRKGRDAGKCAHMRKGTTSRVMLISKPRASF
jgi:hypothetical protein